MPISNVVPFEIITEDTHPTFSRDDRCDHCKEFDKDGCYNCGPETIAKVFNPAEPGLSFSTKLASPPKTAAEVLAEFGRLEKRLAELVWQVPVPGLAQELSLVVQQTRKALTEVPSTFPSWKHWEPSQETIQEAQYWLGYLAAVSTLVGDENHPATADCPEPEYMVCGALDCPQHEPLHYHDGCPVCGVQVLSVKSPGQSA